MSTLVVATCSRKAAQHAVEHWHYSHTMPSGKLVMFGVWEDDAFIGAVVFGRGANDRLLRPYGLKQSQGCELVRVALRSHDAPVSQIVSLALRKLKQSNPGLRLVVSFADPAQQHHGGIYQAGNWLYLGQGSTTREYMLNGRQVHERSVSSMRRQRGAPPAREGQSRLTWLRQHVDPNARLVLVGGKHRYVMPLDRSMRRRVQHSAKPYPHAVEASTVTRLATG